MTMKNLLCRWALKCVAGLGLLALAGHASAVEITLDVPKAPEFDIRRDATVAAVERALPSVVNIATSRMVEQRDWYDDLWRDHYGLPRNAPQTKEELYNLGSGVIIDEDGYILTNLHVVRRATRVQVKLSDGRVFDADKIIDSPKSDVALLKLRAKPGEKFKAIKFAKDDDLLLGETVIALGNPFGLGGSVARGILSSKNRRPTTGTEPLNVGDWLQTDAAINPGNSGGPLVNLHGDLIGLNVAVHRQGQGISFAIPVKQVSSAIADFFSPEGFSMWFGAKLKTDFTPLTIASVQPGSPAAKAGLKPGMNIIEVNEQKPRTLADFWEQMAGTVTSETHDVKLVAFDGGTRRLMNVTLEPFESLVKRRTGLTLGEITPQIAARLGLGDYKGLEITAVEKGSLAEAAGLKPKMLLTSIDGAGVNELRDFGTALVKKGKDDLVHLTVMAFRPVGRNVVQRELVPVELKLREP